MNKLSENWLYIAIGIVTLLFIGGAIFTFSGESKPVEVSEKNIIKQDSQVIGSKDAKVTIVEFSDFQCPACKAAHPIAKQILKEYGDKILFAYRHFPIIAAHQYALKAAEAAEAAGEQGKFWEYHDILFSNQENLRTEDLLKYARELGLDVQKFEDALKSRKFSDKITADMDDGESLGVSATPTFFINNTKYQGVLTYEKFKEIIDAELSK